MSISVSRINQCRKLTRCALAFVLVFTLAFPFKLTPPRPAYASSGSETTYESIPNLLESGIDPSVLEQNESATDNTTPTTESKTQSETEQNEALSSFNTLGNMILSLLNGEAPHAIQTEHTLLVKTTMVDAANLSQSKTNSGANTNTEKSESFETIYSNKERIGDLLIGQYDDVVSLYEIPNREELADYYVGYANKALLNGSVKLVDWQAASLDTGGNIVESIVYDADTGLVYVPKELIAQDKSSKKTNYQIQLLCSFDFSAADPVIDVHITNKSNTVTAVSPSASLPIPALDTTITVPLVTPETADNLDLNRIEVTVDDAESPLKLVENETAYYDQTTGELTLNLTANQVLSLNITIKGNETLDFGALTSNTAHASNKSTANNMNFLHDVDGSLTELSQVSINEIDTGDLYTYQTRMYYFTDGPNVTAASKPSTMWRYFVYRTLYDCLYLGQSTSLARAIINDSSVNLSNLVNPKDESYTLAASALGDSPYDINMAFGWPDRQYSNDDTLKSSTKIKGIDWRGFPITSRDDNAGSSVSKTEATDSTFYRHYGLLRCAHIGQQGSSDDEGNYYLAEMKMRVLYKGADYLVLGFVSPAVNTQTGAAVYKVKTQSNGEISLRKAPSENGKKYVIDNANYTLAGATYGVYTDQTCTRKVGTFTIQADGSSNELALEVGTYYLKETKAPTNFYLDQTIHSFEVKSGENSPVDVFDEPKTGKIELTKSSLIPNMTNNNPCYSLEGAIYGVYTDDQATKPYDVCPTLPATDSNGHALSEELGIGTYYLKEKSASPGYRIDETIYPITVQGGETTSTTVSLSVEEPPLYDPAGILIGKHDEEDSAYSLGDNAYNSSQGGAHLEGAEFSVNYFATIEESTPDTPTRHWIFKTDDNGCIDLSNPDEYWIGGDELYYTENETPCLPIGTYTLQEVKAPDGYLINNELKTFKATEEGIKSGKQAQFYQNNIVPERIKRGDYQFYKVSSDTQRPMGNIPFKITSTTTGESHILVTDDNGYASTASNWAEHTNKTNANDKALLSVENVNSGGTQAIVDETKFDHEAGIWFGSSKDGSQTYRPDDSRGALPYDTYLLEELRCNNNANYDLISSTFTINKDGFCAPAITYNDTPNSKIWLTTRASDDLDGDKTVFANTTVSINDSVEYGNLIAGKTYTLTASLLDPDTKEPIPGGIESKSFTPTKDSGSQEMKLTVNLATYTGSKLVVYEELSLGTEVVGSHKEPDSTTQCIYVRPPQIKTKARDAMDDDSTLVNDKSVTLIDSVTYSDLAPNQEYSVVGKLMLKHIDITGNTQIAELTDESGTAITSTKTFTPTKSSGVVDVSFTFDARSLESNDEIVIYERLLHNDELITSHEDPDDSDQTVKVALPSLETIARDTCDGDKEVLRSSQTSITDTVHYANLVIGKEYTATGSLMQVANTNEGSPTATPLKDANGINVTATMVFTPATSEGTIEVPFVFDARAAAAGTTIVVYETLSDDETVIAQHEDPTSVEQSVVLVSPTLTTFASDLSDKDKHVLADNKTCIVDEIAYDGVIPQENYRIFGLLMDGTTGLPLLTGNHTDSVSKEELVAFTQGLERALSVAQGTLTSSPASLSATAAKSVQEGINAVAYTLRSSNSPMGSSGIPSDRSNTVTRYLEEHDSIAKHITYSANTFTPTESTGKTQASFKADTSTLSQGSPIVVYELLYDKNGELLATDTALDNSNQTVSVVHSSLSTMATDKSDGDHTIAPQPNTTIIDEVAYQDLSTEKEYTLFGTIMNKATGDPLLIEGKSITSSTTFCPNKSSGMQTMEFVFDGSSVPEGSELVVFEDLYLDDELIAKHEDIGSRAQTVSVKISDFDSGSPEAGFAKTGASHLPLIVLIGLLTLIGTACLVRSFKGTRSGKNTIKVRKIITEMHDHAIMEK